MATKRFLWPTAGKALDANIVRGDNYRITVLTDRLFRLEQDADGEFEDRATQVVFYRDFPAVEYPNIQTAIRGICRNTSHRHALSPECGFGRTAGQHHAGLFPERYGLCRNPGNSAL